MRAERGFTLIEALVALAVVGIAGLATLEALGGELRTATRVRDAYTAAALAESRLAAVAMVPAGELSPLADSLARGAFDPPFAGYRWTASVRSVSDERDLYDVTIRVEGDASTHQLRTRLFRPRPVEASR